MDTFKLQSRIRASDATFFPEALHKERPIAATMSASTSGRWHRYRLVTGNLAANALSLHARIAAVAVQYSANRAKMPNIDILKLFEEAPTVSGSGIDIYDYLGRVDTVSREAVGVLFPDGVRSALARDTGAGFFGVAVRASQSWDSATYATQALVRVRQRLLSGMTALADLSTDQPWLLRHAAEQQLLDLLHLSWTQYTAEPSDANFNAMMHAEETYNSYVHRQMQWLQDDMHPHLDAKLPFPDPADAKELWKMDRMDQLRWDDTFPWHDLPAGQGSSERVTCMRGATLQNGKVTITFRMYPTIHTLYHPTQPITHQRLSYGMPPYIGVCLPNMGPNRIFNPFTTTTGTGIPFGAFGDTSFPTPVEPWEAISAHPGPYPDPELELTTIPVVVPRDVIEHLEVALDVDRPTLAFPAINGSVAPMLALPRIHFLTRVLPLFSGGTQITPIQEGNTVEGMAVRAIPGHPNLIGLPSSGFMVTPAQGQPTREGQLLEILPY